MVVLYGDVFLMYYWKYVFDVGEIVFGYMVNFLKFGCDCFGEIYYFDNVFFGNDGELFEIENVVCMYEEDYGILWKYMNVFCFEFLFEVCWFWCLVIFMIYMVGNYEYGFFWYFYLDGIIQMEIKLMGIVGVFVVVDNVGSDIVLFVVFCIMFFIYQYFFCFCLDFNIDGIENFVYEVDVEVMLDGFYFYGFGFCFVVKFFVIE